MIDKPLSQRDIDSISKSRLTVKIVMPDMHVVDPFAREARRDGDVLLFHIQNQGHEALDIRGRYVIPVRPLDQGLSCKGRSIRSLLEGITICIPCPSSPARQLLSKKEAQELERTLAKV
jgi:hypothetical protein